MRSRAVTWCLPAALIGLSSPTAADQHGVASSIMQQRVDVNCGTWILPAALPITQDNGFNVVFNLQRTPRGLAGSAVLGNARASADGSFVNDRIVVHVYWSGKSIGVYEGQVTSRGRIQGVTFDQWAQHNRALFFSTVLLKCGDFAAAPAPLPPGAPLPQNNSTLKAPGKPSSATAIRNYLRQQQGN